jgi:hypothetical protein
MKMEAARFSQFLMNSYILQNRYFHIHISVKPHLMEENAQEIVQYAIDVGNFSDTLLLREIYSRNCRR